MKAIKYIDQDDFDPSKPTKYAIVDPKVFDLAKQCLAANERGEVKTLSKEESAEQFEHLGYAIKQLKKKSLRAAPAKAAFRK